MATNKWQQIITAVLTRLRTIKTTAGYETNAGNYVFEWRANPLEESEMPGIVVRDTFPEEVISVGEHEHTLLIECFVFTSGATATTQARQVISDIVKAFGTDRYFGGLAEDTQPAPGGGLGTDQANKMLAIAVKPFYVKYLTAPFNPNA
ncbi:MAG: hypothetical protein PHE72_14785 [candidate division Zixibacteria bacterium]|nr:hypothetical protein [candidate division Zixibacteria bacterium]